MSMKYYAQLHYINK